MDESVESSRKEEEKYRKIKVLGEGSMGKVFLVECADDKLLYVMKRIYIGHLELKEKENAMREAQLHSILVHPNIIAFKEIYHTTGDKLCIIMEYADGGDLDEFIKMQQKPLDQASIIQLFAQICLGVREIHANKIVHRDLKGANIFVTQTNILKIGDFGISKSLDQTSMASKSFVGTPYYLCPEMVEGKPYSTKADIWALGVILYHLCTFRLPFEANSLPVLALKILKGSFPPLTSQIYSKELKSLILSLLQVDAKKRPSVYQILVKPLVFKLLSKEDQGKVQFEKNKLKNEKVKHPKSETGQSRSHELKEGKIKNYQKGDEKDKQQKKEEQKSKREEMRKQMRDDLKIKRKQAEKDKEDIDKNYQTENLRNNEPEIKKNEINSTIKPWKNKKIVPSNKEINVEIYLPELKQAKGPTKPEIPGKDFTIEIFQGKKPADWKSNGQEERGEAKGKRISLGQFEEQKVNYHYQKNETKSQSEEDEANDSEQSVQEEIEESLDMQGWLDKVKDQVKNVGEITNKLPNSYPEICLYEESENFDNTINVKQSSWLAKMDNFKEVEQVVRSESLEELRCILEQRLGDQKFYKAYSILKNHVDEYYEMEIKNDEEKESLKEEHIFNRTLLKEKLSFLREEEFDSNIELLYTVIIYEDIEMRNNSNHPHDSNNYQKLL